jgi:hypothetical protein
MLGRESETAGSTSLFLESVRCYTLTYSIHIFDKSICPQLHCEDK